MTVEEYELRLEQLRNEWRNGKRSRMGIELEAKALKMGLRIKKQVKLFK